MQVSDLSHNICGTMVVAIDSDILKMYFDYGMS
jgi:hypothetical protein